MASSGPNQRPTERGYFFLAPFDAQILNRSVNVGSQVAPGDELGRLVGVEEYWIIDRFSRTMTVYRWRGTRWAKQTVKEAEAYSTKLLPGFELPLKRLLTLADKYRGG